MKREGDGQERYWRAHLSAWRRSGLTQREYCDRQGIKEWSLSSWKSRLDHGNPGATSFVPVAVVDRSIPNSPGFPESRSPLTLVIGGRYRVEVGEGFSSDTLTRLLSILGRL